MNDIKHKINKGYELKKKEAIEIYRTIDSETLYEIANEVRLYLKGENMDLCSIMNAKSGRCSEDCKYCSQSAHYDTGVSEYPLINKNQALKRAEENSKYGIKHFSLVTSGKGISAEDFENILEIYRELKIKFPNLSLCASHGIIDFEQAIKLKEVGVDTYHHNLETSKRLYKEICTTHTYQDRINTIKNAQKAGLEVCSGGIIGMGETVFDRINMAYELKKLDIKSIPINILCPVKGTPYGDKKILEAEVILKTIAIYRLILPKTNIRFAGGRIALKDYKEKSFKTGISALMVGNYLTTIGNNIEDDLDIIKNLGYKI
jgi:biotin synthase